MCGRKRCANLRDDLERAFDARRSILGEHAIERFAVDLRQGHVEEARLFAARILDFTGVDDGTQIFSLKPAQDRDLAHEASANLGVAEKMRVNDFERDDVVFFQTTGFVDDAGSAFAEHADDFVFLAEHRTDRDRRRRSAHRSRRRFDRFVRHVRHTSDRTLRNIPLTTLFLRTRRANFRRHIHRIQLFFRLESSPRRARTRRRGRRIERHVCVEERAINHDHLRARDLTTAEHAISARDRFDVTTRGNVGEEHRQF
jgi:hypothetical protein